MPSFNRVIRIGPLIYDDGGGGEFLPRPQKKQTKTQLNLAVIFVVVVVVIR